MKKLINLRGFALLVCMLYIGFVSCSKDEAKPEKFFTLTIKTNPTDAKVLINGKETKTYTTKTNEAEKVEYEVNKEGYATIKATHNIAHTETLNIVLSQEFAAVKKDGKWGYINKLGVVMIPFQYELAAPFANGLAAVQKENGNWFLIDTEGNEALALTGEYTYVSPFYGEYAIVKNPANKYGMINTSGNEVIACINTVLEPFVDGLAKFAVGWQKFGYYNESGVAVVPGENRTTRSNPRGGLGMVEKNYEKVNIFDRKGAQIGDFIFTHAWSFTVPNDDFYNYKSGSTENLLAAVTIPEEPGSMSGLVGYINEKAETVIDFQYKRAYPFSEGLAVVKNDGHNPGIINTQGDTIVDFASDRVEFKFYFTEGLIGILKKGQWGFMDKTGQIVIEPAYSQANYFVEGVVSVMKDENSKLWGFISKTGDKILDCTYTKVYNSSQGIILVKEGYGVKAKFLFFDHKGVQIINEAFEDAWYFTAVNEELPYWTRHDLPSVEIVKEQPHEGKPLF